MQSACKLISMIYTVGLSLQRFSRHSLAGSDDACENETRKDKCPQVGWFHIGILRVLFIDREHNTGGDINK